VGLLGRDCVFLHCGCYRGKWNRTLSEIRLGTYSEGFLDDSCVSSATIPPPNVPNRQNRNKWVLNTTDTPVFFLFCQILVAILMFLVAHVVGILRLPRMVDLALLKGLAPMITINVLGLK
jgi:hypothetical protein